MCSGRERHVCHGTMVAGRIPCCIVRLFWLGYLYNLPNPIYRLFLAGIDLPLKRLQAAISVCGNNPRQCLDAAVSLAALSDASQSIIAAINRCKDLHKAISQAHTGQPIHEAFEIYPALPSRQLDSCLMQPISEWALLHMIAELDRQGADAAYNLYQALGGTPAGALLGERLLKSKILCKFSSQP